MTNWLLILTIIAGNSFSSGDQRRMQDCRVRGGNVLIIGDVATCIPRYPLVQLW